MRNYKFKIVWSNGDEKYIDAFSSTEARSLATAWHTKYLCDGVLTDAKIIFCEVY